MNAKAVYAICTVILGCMLNNIFLEYIIKLDPGAGHLITFLQFVFIAIHGYIFTSKFGTVQPKIARKEYIVLVCMFFITSVVNNWAFNFNIPVPLHMIFRAGSLIANMFMGIIILKKKYTWDKYLSVFMITAGITICTLYSSKQLPKSCSDCDVNNNEQKNEPSEAADLDHFFWWLIGIILLTAALLLSARMGIYQESMYKKHGKHPNEALYYTHLFSLPAFIIYGGSIWEHTVIATNSELYNIPFLELAFPIIWIYLILNVITQYMCVSSVYVLTTECSSLTMTLVLTLRKFLSLIFSIVYFQNPFTVVHWFGTFLVFVGTLLFTEVPKRVIIALEDKEKKVKVVKKLN